MNCSECDREFKYRCMRCNRVKNDNGVWIKYLRVQCKLCKQCANVLKAKQRKK